MQINKNKGNAVELKSLRAKENKEPEKPKLSKKKITGQPQKVERFQIVNSFQYKSRKQNWSGYSHNADVYKFYTESTSSDLFKIKLNNTPRNNKKQ